MISISKGITGTNYLIVLLPENRIVNIWNKMRIIESIKVKEYYEGQFEKVFNEFKNKY